MMVQTEESTKYCPHCFGKMICDCAKCGRKARYIDFGGTWHKYRESCTCKICGGTGLAPR